MKIKLKQLLNLMQSFKFLMNGFFKMLWIN